MRFLDLLDAAAALNESSKFSTSRALEHQLREACSNMVEIDRIAADE